MTKGGRGKKKEAKAINFHRKPSGKRGGGGRKRERRKERKKKGERMISQASNGWMKGCQISISVLQGRPRTGGGGSRSDRRF